MTPPADPERYKNHRFPGEIISHGVWLYYRFPLSYRDVGRVSETCGYCLEASPVPSALCPSAGHQASNQIFSLSLSPPCLV